MAEWGSQARRAPPRAAAKTLKTPRRRRRGREGGGGDGDAGEGRGAAVDKEVRGGGAVPAAVPEGVDAAGGEGGGGRLPRQPEAGVQVGSGRLRPPDAAELALPPGAQGQALPFCLSLSSFRDLGLGLVMRRLLVLLDLVMEVGFGKGINPVRSLLI